MVRRFLVQTPIGIGRPTPLCSGSFWPERAPLAKRCGPHLERTFEFEALVCSGISGTLNRISPLDDCGFDATEGMDHFLR